MSISYEEAISTLKVMFPDWDEETLSTVLVSNQYHVERTIENILSMCGDADAAASTATNHAPSPPPAVQSPERRGSSHVPAAAPAPAPAPAPSSATRGIKCSLPDDFLRPPGYQYRIFADEELALMLQNELFQREVRAMFGEDFVRQAASGNAAGRQHAPRQGAAAAGRNANTPAEGASNTDGDLGILKSISSMGGAARRNLSLLASRFSSGQQQTRNGETGTSREFKPLVDGNGDDEDEVEFVSFDNRDQNRSRHVLQDTADTNDSENPLFQTNYSSTGASRVYQQREL
eukprot:gene8160-5875_t